MPVMYSNNADLPFVSTKQYSRNFRSALQVAHVTRHTSHVTSRTSHVTRHTSHVTRHTSHVTRRTSRVVLAMNSLLQRLVVPTPSE
jgi:hypothetical protein